MKNETMTIHRALAELKLIDSKIEKKIQALAPIGIMQKDKLVNGTTPKDEFNKDAISKYDSIKALIARKKLIKSAIVETNVKTIIEIAGKKMTIADAINHKNVIELTKHFIEQLKSAHAKVLGHLQTNNEKVNEVAILLAEKALGKDNVKIDDGDAVAITKPYIESNEFVLVDPLEIEKEIDIMETETLDFETEIDAVLSEINAVTIIEI